MNTNLIELAKEAGFKFELDDDGVHEGIYVAEYNITNRLTKFAELIAKQYEWISVKDRLPELNPVSIDKMEINGQKIGELYSTNRVLYVVNGTVFCGRLERVSSTIMPNATHWQPLPAAPKEIK